MSLLRVLTRPAVLLTAGVVAMVAFTNSVMAESLDDEIYQRISDASALKSGQKIYVQSCSSCHAKDLSGTIGFNLKDGEWVHGDSPAEIYTNIEKGFAKAGMPGFKGLISASDLKSVVAFILSKREGFKGLAYKIYHLDKNAAETFDILKNKKPAKMGIVHKNIASFGMPEVKHYGIEFEGEFYAPSHSASKLILTRRQPKHIQVWVDGVLQTSELPKWNLAAWPLKPGKQHLKIRFITPGTDKRVKRNFAMFVSSGSLDERLFPITTAAQADFKSSAFNIASNKAIAVQRKRIIKLPEQSIAVGFPEDVNYAFNALNCAVVGMWQGAFLNVGPNINGRGQDGSVPLGDWVFHSPQALKVSVNGVSECQFNKYTRNDSPVFFFTVDGTKFSLDVQPGANKALTLNYKTLTRIKKPGFFGRLFGKKTQPRMLSLTLPSSPNLMVTTASGTRDKNTVEIDLNNAQSFSIELAVKESN